MHALTIFAITRPARLALVALILAVGVVGGPVEAIEQAPTTLTTSHPQVTVVGSLRVEPTYTLFGGTAAYPGTTFTVTVTDAGRNVTFGPGNDVALLQVRRNADTYENVNLAESTTTAGTFSGQVDINTVLPTDPVPTDTVRFRYVESAALGSNAREITLDIVGTTATLTVTENAVRGTNMTVTVVDGDRSLQAGGSNDQVTVSVQNQSEGGAFVNFILQETATAGTFQGTILNTDNTIPGGVDVDDVLRVRYVDEFRASGQTNTDVFDTHAVRGTDGQLSTNPNVNVSPTGILTVTVVDADQNATNGDSNDTIPAGRVLVREVGTANQFNLQLNETSTAGTFQGQGNLATLGLATGEQIEVIYTDVGTAADNGATPDGTPTTTDRTVGPIAIGQGVNGQLIVPPSVPRGGTFEIRLVDADLNTGLANQDTGTSVSIRICEAPTFTCVNNTVIVLTEQTNNQGTFVLNYSAMLANFPNIENGDRLRVLYNDTPTASGVTPVTRQADITIGGLDTATIEWSPVAIFAAQSSTITVRDVDQNDTPGGNNDTVQVTIWNVTIDSPKNTYTLQETGTEGVFSLAVNSGERGLNSRVGHVIRAQYNETVTPDGNPRTITADLNIGNIGTLTTIEAPASLIVGGTINYIVREPNLGNTESITVTVTNTRTQDFETRIFARRGDQEGVYEGTVATALTPDDAREGFQDGIINVQPGDTLRISYTDATTPAGREQAVTADTRMDSRRSPTVFCNQRTGTTNPVWNVAYYANTSLTDPAVLTTQESNMSINWGNTAPYRAVPADGWSARWTTTLNFTQGGRFRFRIGVDDGVRFFVNDQVVIDQFVGGSFREFFADVNLEAGDNRFTIEMFDGAADAGLLAECLFLEDPVAVIDPSTQDARGGFNVDFLFPSEIDFDEARAHVATGRLHVRANPTVQAERIDMVFLYQSFPILGVTDDNGWYLIDLGDGRTGWVATRFIYRNERTPVRIFPSFVGSEAQLPNIEVTGFATEELVIRSAPRTGNEVGILPQDAAFLIVARSQSGAWYRIDYQGINGWVFSPFVVLTNGTVQDLPRE